MHMETVMGVCHTAPYSPAKHNQLLEILASLQVTHLSTLLASATRWSGLHRALKRTVNA